MTDFQTLFPDEREKAETRLKQCQSVMLRMLKVFDYLCNKYNIKYFLTGGSLIGAIRHNGFIPWDDDLDVGMTRDQYEFFIKHAVPELPEDIFFQSPQTDHHYPVTSHVDARLRDKFSSYKHLKKPGNKWHEGLQLDIFVYDCSFPPNNYCIVTINKLLKLLNNDKKRAQILKWIAKYAPFNLSYCSNYMQYFRGLKSGTYVTKAEIQELDRIQFEDAFAYIPKGFDSYLKRQYGDYMQLPPSEARVSGHDVIGNPFTPCNHSEILFWEERKLEGGEKKIINK